MSWGKIEGVDFIKRMGKAISGEIKLFLTNTQSDGGGPILDPTYKEE